MSRSKEDLLRELAEMDIMPIAAGIRNVNLTFEKFGIKNPLAANEIFNLGRLIGIAVALQKVTNERF